MPGPPRHDDELAGAQLAVGSVPGPVPAAGAGWLTFTLLGGVDGWTVSDRFLGFVGAAIIGVVTLAVYAGILAAFRTPELAVAARAVRRFLPGR